VLGSGNTPGGGGEGVGQGCRAGGTEHASTVDYPGGPLKKVATIHIPIRVPFGFHSEFVPEQALRGAQW